MKLEEFDYLLDESFIAQDPLKKRSSSKLLAFNTDVSKAIHLHFSDIINLLNPGDALVFNETKVLKARLFGRKESGGKIELLVLNIPINNKFKAMVKGGQNIKIGSSIILEELSITCVDILEDGIKEFSLNTQIDFLDYLEKHGVTPLPPYIKKTSEDSRYQTVYAKTYGSVAAPTAGLHFDEVLLEKLKEKGVRLLYLNLSVGLGTFKTVTVDDIESHHMHSEYYELSKDTAEILNETKINGFKIVAVGTTSLRVLETIYQKFGFFHEDFGDTDIFIYPPQQIKSIDALITNFHLPKSTLLMLIATLMPLDIIKSHYELAKKNNYRFFSFGDACFITNNLRHTRKNDIIIDTEDKILVHCCCAPCLAYSIYDLQKFNFDILFYNPNIVPSEEYLLRLTEVKRLINYINTRYKKTIKLIECEYDNSRLSEYISTHTADKEGKSRCFFCINSRIKECLKYDNYEYFTSTLLASANKSAKMINYLGKNLSSKFVDIISKKSEARELGKSIIEELNIYQQNYCGCKPR